MRPASVLLLLLGLLAPMASGALGAAPPGDAAVTPRRVPPPKWVEAGRDLPEPVFQESDLSDGLHHLTIEAQVNVGSAETFRRYAWRIAGRSGLEAGSTMELDFDPTYQQIDIHWVSVRRGAQDQDRLTAAPLRVLDRESDLERRLLNGARTVLIVLEDLQVGDIVDYAYTIRGHNPAFEGGVFRRFPLAHGFPVEFQKLRLVSPPDRFLQHRVLGSSRMPSVRTLPTGERETRLELVHTPAVHFENRVPAWHRTLPEIQFSSWQSWAEAVQWLGRVYASEDPLPEALRSPVDAIRTRASTDADRASAALRFVQARIRYLGMEMGRGSYWPRRPAEVVATGFGDCKDKSLLLARMLRELGIDAAPALVNTGWHRGIADFLPSPIAFDHVVVRAEVGGQIFWLDPTRPEQPGPLERITPADYGLALPALAGTAALEAIRRPDGYRSHAEITERFRSAAAGEPVDLAVHSLYEGGRAESIRSYFARNSLADIGRYYAKYYTELYPGAESVTPIRFEDHPESNRFEVWEGYRIPGFWARETPDAAWRADVWAQAVRGDLVVPDTARRVAPLALPGPASVRQTIELELWEPWTDLPAPSTTEFPFLKLETRAETGGNLLRFEAAMETRADHVPVEAFESYSESVHRMRNKVAWVLTYNARQAGVEPAPGRFAPRWSAFAAVIAALCTAGAAGWVLVPRRRIPPLPRPGDPRLEGLTGWLILPHIGLWSALVTLPVGCATSHAWTLDATRWAPLLATFDAAKHSAFTLIVHAEIFANSLLVFLVPVLLVGFLRRRAWTPGAMVGFHCLVAVILLADGMASDWIAIAPADASTAESQRAVMRSFVALFVWVPYFLVSKRVRATFRH